MIFNEKILKKIEKYKKQQIEKKISLHVGKFLDYREFFSHILSLRFSQTIDLF